MRININYNSNYFWRILFTVMITIMHCNWLNGHHPGWYLCVEYFFMLSGFFLMKKFEEKKENPFKYIGEKIIKLYPHQLFSFMILFLWSYWMILREGEVAKLLNKLVLHLGEALPFTYFFSDYLSLGTTFLNFSTWYISVMLLVSLFFYSVLFVHPAIFKNIIVPLSIILVYRYFYYYCENINLAIYEGILINGNYLRGIGGMACGCMIYEIVKKLQSYSFTKTFFRFVRVMEVIFMGGMIGLSWFYADTKSDVFLVMLLAMGVICTFLHAEETILSGKMVRDIHTITFPLYLNHLLIFSVLNSGLFLLPSNFWLRYLIFLLVAIPYSIISNWLVNKIVAIFKHLGRSFLDDEGMIIKDDVLGT